MENKLHILLADDSRFFRTIEAKFLQKTPAEILEADSYETALSVARRHKPDLIYMSAALPPKGGAECCGALKNDLELKHIPVVMICDEAELQTQRQDALDRGCNDILVKPLDRHQFLQVGRKYLTGIREHRQPVLFSLNFKVGDEEFAGKCLDLSGGGLFLETQEVLASGTILSLRFKLPGSARPPVECRTEVMWHNRKPDPMKPHYPHGYGLKFIDLPAEYQREISEMSKT